MRLFSFVCCCALAGTALADTTFVSAPLTDANDSYVAGNGAGARTDPNAATGAPGGVAGAADGFPNIVDPFNPNYEASQVTGIGLGGRVAYAFPTPVSVINAAQIGIFANVGLNDTTGNGTTADANMDPAQTFDIADANGAERTSVVEVADTLGDWKSLGRVTFDLPENYYANAGGPYDAAPPANPVLADFSKPFTGTLSSFDNKSSFSDVLGVLDGSAGGTWLTVPQSAGLSEINFIRFSDPKWLYQGNLVDSVSYFGSPTNAAIFINAISANAAALPEPASLSLLGVGMILVRRRS